MNETSQQLMTNITTSP